jgi:hypothetical protein
MTLDEMLKLTDDLVFAKTGQHLNDLQEKVVRGTIQGETYEKIAEDFHCNESYVRDIGAKLWHIFSESLGEEVNKSNLRSAMQRLQVSLFSNVVQDHVQVGSINFCEKTRQPPDIPNSHFHSQQSPTENHELSEMPELGVFYNRTSELETLKTWILQEHGRLITITGISGIGKTQLAVKLIQQIKHNFEYILWYNLDHASSFTEFKAELIELFDPNTESELIPKNGKRLKPIKYLQKHRCLVIIDNLNYLFCSNQLAGQYQPEYEEFRYLFKQIEELPHQSCFLLIGWEQPIELVESRSSNLRFKALTIRGLETTAIAEFFPEQELGEYEKLTPRIHQYQGNPLWLNIIANFITEMEDFGDKIIENNPIFLPQSLKDNLQQQFNRLSPIEKQVLLELVQQEQPVNLAQLLIRGQIPSSDLFNAIKSLFRRCWLEKPDHLYRLPAVLRQYIIELNH